jgi:7-cyano-7-deazaguanine synthase
MFDEVVAVSFDYRQRHRAELESAKEIAAMAGAKHVVLDAGALAQLGGNALVDETTEIAAAGGLVDTHMPDGLPSTFVPGRNLLFLSIAAAVAVRHGSRDIVTGVCETDFSGYPDCREVFVRAMADAATLAMPSGSGPIRIHTPLMHITKADTVRLARRLPGCWEALSKSLTCYQGRRPGCGECPACKLRRAGFEGANEIDPAEVVLWLRDENRRRT